MILKESFQIQNYLRLVCDNLIRVLPNNLINLSLIYGIPYGGLPIASYLAITNNKGLIYSRNKKKEYGTKKLVEDVIVRDKG